MAKPNHLPLIDIKPCKLLHRGHVPYSVVARTKRRPSGVYKVAYMWETVYVGSSSNVIKDLRKQFSGNGKLDLIEFLLNLTKKELEMVSVYWLDEAIHVHSCGKSYLECITDLQGRKPKFNDIQPILCSMSAASVVSTDSQTLKHGKGQSQDDVSIRPSNATEEPKTIVQRRLGSADKRTSPGFSVTSRKRPAEEDGERSQFHTDQKKIKTGQLAEQPMNRPLTTNPEYTAVTGQHAVQPMHRPLTTKPEYTAMTGQHAEQPMHRPLTTKPEYTAVTGQHAEQPVHRPLTTKPEYTAVTGQHAEQPVHRPLTTKPEYTAVTGQHAEQPMHRPLTTKPEYTAVTGQHAEQPMHRPLTTKPEYTAVTGQHAVQPVHRPLTTKPEYTAVTGQHAEQPMHRPLTTNPEYTAVTGQHAVQPMHRPLTTKPEYTAMTGQHAVQPMHRPLTTKPEYTAMTGQHAEQPMHRPLTTNPEYTAVTGQHAVQPMHRPLTTKPEYTAMTGQHAEQPMHRPLTTNPEYTAVTGQHAVQPMHRPLTTNPEDTPVCRSQTANLHFSATMLSTNVTLKMQSMETPKMLLNNIPRRPVISKLSYKQRSQSQGGATVDMSLNHENLTTQALLQQFCISPRSPEFEERIQRDKTGYIAGRSEIRKDNCGNIPISTITKGSQPVCPTTSHFDKESQKGLQPHVVGDKCESTKEKTFRDRPNASQRHSLEKYPRFQTSSGGNEQTHTVSSTQSQSTHAGITPSHEFKPSNKDPGQNELSNQENKVSAPCASSGNDPEGNIQIPPFSSTSVSGLAEAVRLFMPDAVPEPETHATRSCTGIPIGDSSKLLERILKAAPVKPSSPCRIKTPSGRRKTMNETTSSSYKGPDANIVRMLVCDPLVSSTQTCKSNQSPQTKVPNKAAEEPHSETKVPNKDIEEPHSQTRVPNKPSGEPHLQPIVSSTQTCLSNQTSLAEVPNKAAGGPRSQTKVANIACGEPCSQKKVPIKDPGRSRLQPKVPNMTCREPRLQTIAPNMVRGEPRSQTKVPNKDPGETRTQPKVPNVACGKPNSLPKVPSIVCREPRSQSKAPNIACGESRSKTKVPSKDPGESRTQPKVPNKACAEPRSKTKVPNKACAEPRSKTKVPNKACAEPRSKTKVPNKACAESRSKTKVPNKACAEPRSKTKVPNKACGESRSQTKVPCKDPGERRTIRTQSLPKKDSDTVEGAGVFSVIKTIGSKVFTMMNPFASNGGQ
ncbi:nascent polypeptide-associated complex subunit alpha, muscle-specific form-like [Haliotis asinina]|uniref:nascent polypeptide-associated complex subunit alpha, muscle-specific form-like n=1 Tax=Haliotis asinina TaxID=109174 RepID=UPI003531BE73